MKSFWGIFIFIFLLVNVNALILIEDDFDNKYSLGERVLLNYSVVVDDSCSGFLETYLVCDDDRSLVDKRFVFLDNENRNYEVEFLLNNEGDCVFEVEFLGDEVKTEEFEISSDVSIDYSLSGKNFFPGEEILIEGHCKKFNSEDCKGIIRFIFGEDFEKDYFLDSGDFFISYMLKDDFDSGSYVVGIENIERDFNGRILSYGKEEDLIFVKSVPTYIEIEGDREILPSENYTYSINVLDQSKKKMQNETVIVKLTDSENNIFYEGELVGGKNISFSFPSDFRRGTAHLSSFYGSFGESIELYVDDNKEVSSNIIDNSIVFENIGNIFYEGVQKYEIISENESFQEFVNLSLDIGESYSLPLKYSGIYNISSGGKQFSRISLTGAAISIGDNFNYKKLIGAFLFLILLGFGYYFVKKKVGGKKEISHEQSPVDLVKNGEKEEKSNKKVIVKESKEKEENLKNNVYMVFFKVDSEILDYEKICLNYGFKLHKVNSSVGYVVFYENKKSLSDDRIFKFGCSLYNFSKARGDKLSLVLNKGYFEKKLNLFKKFAMINKYIMDDFLGKFIIGDKLMKGLYISSKKERIIEIKSRKIRVWEIFL